VLIEIQEGRMAGPLLDNGLARFLVEAGCHVLIVSPAARVPACVDRWGGEGISFEHVPLTARMTRMGAYELHLGRRLALAGLSGTRRALWKLIGQRLAARRRHAEAALLRRWNPDVVVATHLSNGHGRGLVAVARRQGIPTVGNLVSWDNVLQSMIRVRPDRVTCWSRRNKEELERFCAYRPDDIRVIGAPALDAYSAGDGLWSRQRLCDALRLDPSRPILVYASLGQIEQYLDETSSFEILLRLIDSGAIRPRPQVVLRLHPTSRESFFAPFARRNDVTVSRYDGYVPWMAWTPWREEIILAGNLLRHADVCVSPGSTMTVESAIFDTPTVMPVINEYQPDRYARFIDSIWLKRHFAPLVEKGLLPLASSAEELAAAVNRAMEEPHWFREERAEVRELLFGPLDGCATRRLAGVILEEAAPGAAVRGAPPGHG